MNVSALQSVWPILALLAYMLLYCTSKVLAAQRANQVDVHDRIRRAKELRREYHEAVRERQAQL